jgi:glycerol-3-phosphate acyltransferase PlsY
MFSIFAIILLSYLVGSIPTSIIMSKLFQGIDIRDYGSGNAGGANTIRVLGWKIGLVVILVDVGKGVLATLLISRIIIDPPFFSHNIIQLIAGSSAIVGHIWTVFAGFKGGKGVATGAGMLFCIYPVAGTICLAIFCLVLLTTKIVSLSSLTAAVVFPLVLIVLNHFFNYSLSTELLFFAILMAVLIIFTHRSNIIRLLKGQERGFKKKTQRI